MVVSLCGGRLLGHFLGRLFGFGVFGVVEALAVELGESDVVGLVGDEEIEDGPHEREAAVSCRWAGRGWNAESRRLGGRRLSVAGERATA